MKKNVIPNSVLLETAERFGTPVYLYNHHCIENTYTDLREMLSKHCDIFYSMKANPTLAICDEFKLLGSGCEVSSSNELLMALKIGFQKDKIIFVGPGKKRHELVLAVENNIRHIVCESIDEISTVNEISKNFEKITSILIRINPDFLVSGAPIKMSGVATQFGMDVADFLKNSDAIRHFNFIRVDGIQIYNASRVLYLDSIIKNISNIFSLVSSLSYQAKMQFNVIDFGGGFGIPYFENETDLNIKILSLEINKLIDSYKMKNPNAAFIMELGRYLIAESGYLVSSVQSVKKSHDKNYIILDAGMHCYLGATGIGSFVHRNFPMRHIATKNEKNNLDEIKYQITGPLCTPGDVLLKDVVLSEVVINDLIIIEKTGAYGLSASPGKFISHGSPAEVIYKKPALHLMRHRERLSDLLSTQVINKGVSYA